MEYTITCSGIPVGVASIAPLSGLAHAPIRVLPAYAMIREHAIRVGEELGRGRRLWSAVDGDFAEALARSWRGGRLALVDALGVELGVASVLLLARAGNTAHVVVDARPDMARVEAFLRSIDGGTGGGWRSAA
jgi:hypothetical protein